MNSDLPDNSLDSVIVLLFFCCIFIFPPILSKGGRGVMAIIFIDNKGTSTALIPSLCTFPLLKTVRNIHLGSESADNGRFLSADERFERF